jgi:hypothetical protein
VGCLTQLRLNNPPEAEGLLPAERFNSQALHGMVDRTCSSRAVQGKERSGMRDRARSIFHGRPDSTAIVPVLALMAIILVSAGHAQAQVGGGGPLPIPCFTQYTTDATVYTGGGTASPTVPLRITFDPSCTYLPDQVNNVPYFYRLVWQFGEDTDPNVRFVTYPDPALPPLAANAILALPAATVFNDYFGDTFQPVKLTVRGYVQNATGGFDEVLSDFVKSTVRVAPVNFIPHAELVNVGSQLTSTQRTVTVNVSNSFDEDGYILWAAIDWGDGTAELITPPPKNTPVVTLSHTYSTIGIYKITVSVIDNGRFGNPSVFTLPVVPAPNDPVAAAAAIAAVHEATPLSSALFDNSPVFSDVLINPAALQDRLDPKFNPKLSQKSIIVQIPGDMVAVSGKFKVDFVKTANDSFDLTLKVNSAIENAANTNVNISIGSGATALALPALTTDGKGKAKSGDISFSFDAKRLTIRLKIKRATLGAALNALNTTEVNGFRDVPVTIQIGNTVLITTVRFTYNSTTGKSGIGKNARSNPTGN